MYFTAFLLILSAAVNIILAAFIYRRNPRSPINKSFGIFALNIGLWTLFVYAGVFATHEAQAIFWIHMSFASAAFIPATCYIFTRVFPEDRAFKFTDLNLLFSSIFVAFIIFRTPLLYAVQLGERIPKTHYSLIFPVYIVYFLFGMALALHNLARKWKISIGIKRLQIQYVFFGILLHVIASGITNFVAPLLGIDRTEGYGPVFTLLMTGFIVYAIARYHLMDITIVIKRTTLYAVLTASITCGYIGLVVLSNWLFGGIWGIQSVIPAMLAALLIAFAFAPLKEGLQLFIDRTLFKKRYDHRKIIGDLSKILTSIFNLDELLDLILEMITRTMGLRKGVFFLPALTGGTYQEMAHQPENESNENYVPIASTEPIVKWLMEKRKIIVREQMERRLTSGKSVVVINQMDEMMLDICMPIFSKEVLSGILFLGPKKSGEPFTAEDVEMFVTLSHHIGVAIENSQLYTKVEENRIYQEILLNNLTSGVVAIDLNNRITTFNSKAENILGVEASRAIGTDISLLSSELREPLLATLRQRENLSNKEVTLRVNGGREIPLAVSSSIFKSRDDKILGALIVFYDLTERKILEMEMRRTDRLASLGTLAAGMAHEIKNPLVSLKTFTQLIPEKYDDKEFRENFSKIATNEVDRINNLVEQLLNFARPAPPTFRETDLCEVLENTLVLLQSRINEQNAWVNKDIKVKPLLAMADGDQLRQVFINVIINALQSMDKGDALTIVVDVRKAKKFARSSDSIAGPRKDGRYIWGRDYAGIEISDAGKGIDPEDLPHLFDPFFTTRKSGAGLGLSIAHSIVKEHQGLIEVRSRLGKGTSFSILLPLSTQHTGEDT